jgi:squalene synthase HpnC
VSDIEELASGKGSGDENFPVASALIARRHRPLVLAFYRVARLSDDVAYHPGLSSDEKLRRLDAVEASLTGAAEAVPAAVALKRALAQRGLGDRHMLDLLTAFRRDAVQTRYADWDELMDYCRYSAAPVGRFVLDVHGEARTAWPASDALCAALQVINHLQDCGKDYRDLDRVYIPLDALSAAGVDAKALGEARGTPALRRVISDLAERTSGLLRVAAPLAGSVRDLRLALEIGVIQTLAGSLTRRLMVHDPLSQRVHHTRIQAVGVALRGAATTFGGRLSARPERQAEA